MKKTSKAASENIARREPVQSMRSVQSDENDSYSKPHRCFCPNENGKLHIVHPLLPVWNAQSEILILGTMPSPASRERCFYYMHSQNRFWRVLSEITGEPLQYKNSGGEKAVSERKRLLLRYKIALWDVLSSCDIHGASDASIQNVAVNDFSEILRGANITRIFCTGKKALALYKKYCEARTKIVAEYLPSTSAANRANWSEEKLVREYKKKLCLHVLRA